MKRFHVLSAGLTIAALLATLGCSTRDSSSAKGPNFHPWGGSSTRPDNPLQVVHANSNPTRVFYGADSRYYVSDSFANSVFIYDSSLNPVGELKNLGSPLGVAADRAGNIYVGNGLRHNVEVYDNQGKPISTTTQPPISMPNDLAFDRQNRLYVVDSRANSVLVYSPDGQYLSRFGADTLKFPVSIAFSPAGEIYVADQGNSRVAVFQSNGQYLRSFGDKVAAFSQDWHGRFVRLQSLAFDARGNLHAADSYLQNVQILNPSNGLYLDSYGGYGAAAGQLNLPLDIAISSEGKVLVANRENHRIEFIYTVAAKL